MPNDIYFGFDFGFSRIGMAVGQRLTCTASPLPTVSAVQGVPDWDAIQREVSQWHPDGFIVGFPTCIDGKALYTSKASRRFAADLEARFSIPTCLVDERLTTVEARAHLFAKGGYKRIKKAAVDSIAACIILEQWLQGG